MQLSALYYLRYVYEPSLPVNSERMEFLLESLQTTLRRNTPANSIPDQVQIESPSNHSDPVLFPFDPNRMTVSDWMRLGLSVGKAKALVRYVDQGGTFKIKQDLLRWSMLEEGWKLKASPFILLPDRLISRDRPKEKPGNKIVDINQADVKEWEALPGIGNVLAERIIKYRERLGGFYAVSQVKEVYGISDSLWLILQNQLELQPQSWRVFDIRTVDWDTLRHHPYFSRALLRQLERYRMQHEMDSVGELRRLPLVTDENYRKFAPYLSVGHQPIH